jgi:hypothetical protein
MMLAEASRAEHGHARADEVRDRTMEQLKKMACAGELEAAAAP